jgi:hypothetical protein
MCQNVTKFTTDSCEETRTQITRTYLDDLERLTKDSKSRLSDCEARLETRITVDVVTSMGIQLEKKLKETCI